MGETRRATEAKRSSAVLGAARETGEGVIAARPGGVTPTASHGEAWPETTHPLMARSAHCDSVSVVYRQMKKRLIKKIR